jgi:hypothetical protein
VSHLLRQETIDAADSVEEAHALGLVLDIAHEHVIEVQRVVADLARVQAEPQLVEFLDCSSVLARRQEDTRIAQLLRGHHLRYSYS